jgi:hypothetical protein
VDGDVPPRKWTGIVKPLQLLLCPYVKDGDPAVLLDEMIVIYGESTSRILDELVEPLVCLAGCRSLGCERVDEAAAVDQVRCFSRTRAFLPTLERR